MVSIPKAPRRLVDYGDRVDATLRRNLRRARANEAGRGDAAILSAVHARLTAELGPELAAPPEARRPYGFPRGTFAATVALAGAVGLGLALRSAPPSPSAQERGTLRLAHSASRSEVADPTVLPPSQPAPPAEAIRVSNLPLANGLPAATTGAPRAPRSGPPATQPRGEASAPADEGAELAVVSSAQRALRGDPARALEFVAAHERAFPNGTFAQEREAIAVEALARRGDIDAARARFSRFEVRFPASSHAVRLRPMLALIR